MKQSIALTETIEGFPCLHCGEYKAKLRFIEHDVTPEIEPSVTFVFVCKRCYLKSFVDASDLKENLLSVLSLKNGGYK